MAPGEDAPVRVVVIGSGICGLASALELLELAAQRGHAGGLRVEVWAADETPNTTSDVAGALCHPYRIEPKALVDEWTRESEERYRWMAAEGSPFVRELEGFFLAGAGEEAGAGEVPHGARRCTLQEAGLPPGAPFASALGFRALLVQTGPFLAALQTRLRAAGVEFCRRRLASLDEAVGEAPDALVNCSGLAARFLVPDPAVYGVRGQLVRVCPPLPLERFYIGPDGPGGVSAYAFPRPDFTVLGGLAVDEDGDEALARPPVPDPLEAGRILERCAAMLPALAGGVPPAALSSVAAYRPARRGGVRLELERRGTRGTPVVHNYGHGGAGWTVAWGCGRAAAALALDALQLG